MPELPEVETVRKYLVNGVKDTVIKDVEVLDKRIPLLSELDLSLMKNQKIIDVSRKGKYLMFILDSFILISHLRMEGKYYLYNLDEANSKHARVIFTLDNNTKLIYDDVRRFGTMQLFNKEGFDIHKALPNVGNEPFDYDKEEFYNAIVSKKNEIKSLILDQSIISGIGNIYADEILYKTSISPFKPGNKLTRSETDAILAAAKEILTKAIELGGSTIRSYHPSRDIDGCFQLNLFAYDQENKPCRRCGQKMLKRFLHGRGTTYCPKCQKVGKVVAIYGKMASGKSTVLNMFKNDDYPCFSSDEEVDNLYKNNLNFTLKCVSLFNEECLNSVGKVSKEYVKQVVIQDANKKHQLEGIIHPIIEKKALDFIKNNYDKELIILEIPLLFEAKMEYIADYIIAINVTDYTQIQNLKNRKSLSVTNDLLLNANNMFTKNLTKCDFVIENNDSLDALKGEYNRVLNELKKI